MKFTVPRMSTTFSQETDIVLEIPFGVAYLPKDHAFECHRHVMDEELNLLQLNCEYDFYDDHRVSRDTPDLVMLKWVKIYGICDSFYFCRAHEQLHF